MRPIYPTETQDSTVHDTETVTDAVNLTDDELNTSLEAAAFYRDAKLAERTTCKQPLLLLRKVDPLPDADTLDGQILRAGSLVSVFTLEFMKRDLLRLQAENTARETQSSPD